MSEYFDYIFFSKKQITEKEIIQNIEKSLSTKKLKNINEIDNKTGKTLLHVAILNNLPIVSEYLINRRDTNLSIVDNNKDTPLLLAMLYGYTNITNEILKQNKDIGINVINNDRNTIIEYLDTDIYDGGLFQKGINSKNIISLLLNRKDFDINLCGLYENNTKKENLFELLIHYMLIKLTKRDNFIMETIKKILNKKKLNINQLKHIDYSKNLKVSIIHKILYYYSEYPYRVGQNMLLVIELIDLILLKRKDFNINIQSTTGNTVLHELIKLIYENTKEINLIDNQNEHLKLLEKIISNPKVNLSLKNKRGDTIIDYIAYRYVDINMFKILLKYIDINKKDDDEYFLHKLKFKAEIFKELLKRKDLNINQLDKNGEHIILVVISATDRDNNLLDILLERKDIDYNNIYGSDGNIIHYLLKYGRYSNLKDIFNKNFDIKLLKQKDDHKTEPKTPLEMVTLSERFYLQSNIINLFFNKISKEMTGKNFEYYFAINFKYYNPLIVFKNIISKSLKDTEMIEFDNFLIIKSLGNNYNSILSHVFTNSEEITRIFNTMIASSIFSSKSEMSYLTPKPLSVKNIDWELLLSDISNIFKNADINKRKQLTRSIFNQDFKGIIISEELLTYINNFLEQNKLKKIDMTEYLDNYYISINDYYYKDKVNKFKSNYISPSEFTYLDVKNISTETIVKLENGEDKIKIEQKNEVVWVNSKTNKIQKIKIADFLKYFFNIEKGYDFEVYSKKFITLINQKRYELFTTNDIAKTYLRVQCDGSCMDESESLKLIESDKRVTLIVLKDNRSSKLIGRALMWKDNNWLLVDSAYAPKDLGMAGINMLREFAWKIAIKENRIFYIRLGSGGSKEKYIEYDDKINPPKDLILSSKDAKDGLPELILKDFKFDRNMLSDIINDDEGEEEALLKIEDEYGKLYMDSFLWADFYKRTLATYNTGNDVKLR